MKCKKCGNEMAPRKGGYGVVGYRCSCGEYTLLEPVSKSESKPEQKPVKKAKKEGE